MRRGGGLEDQRDRGCAELDCVGLPAVEHLQETEGEGSSEEAHGQAEGQSKGEEENEAVGSSVTRVFVIASSSGPDFHWSGNVLFNSRTQRPA